MRRGIGTIAPAMADADPQPRSAGAMKLPGCDLFSATGAMPRTLLDVYAREKEIRYSSRTREISDKLLRRRKEHELTHKLLARLPAELADDPDVKELKAMTRENAVNLVHLIYRANAWEGGARDYEFSARTMAEHWQVGRAAVAETMARSELVASNILDGKTAAFDLTRR